MRGPTSTLPASAAGLQPRRRVERVADRSVLELAAPADAPQNREPGLDPDPDRESLDLPLAGDLVTLGGDRVDDLEAGEDRALGIVLVGARGAEQGQQAIARVLEHLAAEALHRRGHPRDGAADHALEVLGIHALAESGRADHVGEQRADDLARLPRRAPAPATGAPQAEQKRASAASSAAQLAQAGVTGRV